MSKKTLMVLTGLLLILTMSVSFFAIVKPSSIGMEASDQAAKKHTIRIAAVNEDAGMTYNGQPVNIASALLASFSSHTDYDVELVSRSIAERGLENNVYQLMLVLPSKFSEEALALETTNPNSATFHYQITSDQSLTVKQAEQAVIDLKSLFNKDLITIYFSSIIGNLQSAQSQMVDAVSNEDKVLSAYQLYLINPLSLHSQQFTGLGTAPNELLSNYLTFNKELNRSTDAFKSIIDVDKTYESELAQIKAQQEGWQQSLSAREDKLLAYDKGFSNLTIEEQLAKLTEINAYVTEKLNEPAIWKDTLDKATAYNQDITSLLKYLRGLNTKINTTLSNYDANIRQAIESSLSHSSLGVGGLGKTLGSYMESLKASMLLQAKQKWPTFWYSDEMIAAFPLSEQDRQHLKNINAFMRWYSHKYSLSLPQLRASSLEGLYLTQVKEDRKRQLAETRSLTISGVKGRAEQLEITVPKHYQLEVERYLLRSLGEGHYQIDFEGQNTSDVTIQYRLSVADSDVTLFSPVVVSAQLLTSEEVAALNTEDDEDDTDEDYVPDSSRPLSKRRRGSRSSVAAAKLIRKATRAGGSAQQVIDRTYTVQDVIADTTYTPTENAKALFQDVQSYLQLSGLATAYFGLDLSEGVYSETAIIPREGSIAALANGDDLKAIMTNLIKQATVEALKADLTVSEEELASIEKRRVSVEELTKTIEGLRAATTDLKTRLSQILEELGAVHKTIQEKPVFTTTEKWDNTDMVAVSMTMNSDLSKLMAASRVLMDNTKSNQIVSETIEGTIKQLSNDVTTLEKNGEALKGHVTELKDTMTGDYGSNAAFLKAFTAVLSNTKKGNAKNTAVYEYLSNPVDASKIDRVLSAAAGLKAVRQDERSGLLIILITYLTSLAVAYLFQQGAGLQGSLRVTQRLAWKNAVAPMTYLSGTILLIAPVIAVISGYRLDFSMGQLAFFALLLAVMMLVMTYTLNLLLEKIRSLGFLMSIGILMLYLITAAQLFDAYYARSPQLLVRLSPLTYLELMVRAFINRQGGLTIPMTILVVLALALAVANAYHYRQVKDR
ncbi:TPA: type VII secretion protein EsaA [Streptococcus equi subsp. zooepidemicus]|uniref:type VII secretion protein EsaA n=1 Tax=Streptococcus equi TaxID=1336 RepID=UPI0002FB953C|nr:type VII secretion protein EsaA [Streptococcus equi]HEL0221427.1 type VII secretion protein EsaA [Streptococcus equi subsp. zooepidemicus]